MNLRMSLMPAEMEALFAFARSKKAQSSLEYVMMIAAASIVIVLAISMVVKLKSAAITSVNVNGTNESIAQAISKELGSLTANAVQ
ncbi:MAG: hypothetical protein ACP5T4_01035 [Candidatus Micrarchaeia archaeon]